MRYTDKAESALHAFNFKSKMHRSNVLTIRILLIVASLCMLSMHRSNLRYSKLPPPNSVIECTSYFPEGFLCLMASPAMCMLEVLCSGLSGSYTPHLSYTPVWKYDQSRKWSLKC